MIIFLARKGLFKLRRKDFIALFLIVSFLVVNKIINPSFSYSSLLFQISLVLSSYIFLRQYKSIQLFRDDLYSCLSFVFFHAAIGYLIYLFASPLFAQFNFSGLNYKGLFVFYVSASTFDFFLRNVGLCWEPGVLQLILNLFLFFSIKRQRNILFLSSIGLSVLSTFSTTGYLILILNILYYVVFQLTKKGSRGKFSLVILVGLMFSTGLIALVQENATNKFDRSNTSTLVRLRDFLIGVELISEKPLLGHGIFDSKYLESKTALSSIESDVFTKGYLNEYGDFSGGYTDGLLGLACWYGIPAAIFIYVLTYKNRMADRIWFERLTLFLILCLTFVSEPITYTSLFLLFPLSRVVFKTSLEKSSNIELDDSVDEQTGLGLAMSNTS
jgi:hypothetical protein